MGSHGILENHHYSMGKRYHFDYKPRYGPIKLYDNGCLLKGDHRP